MASGSMREFMSKREAAGELVRVSEPVSTVLQMTEIHRRLLAEGGPAVLFENVIRAAGGRPPMPSLWNLCGAVRRPGVGVALQARQRAPPGTRRRLYVTS